jgi:hypothetical protein
VNIGTSKTHEVQGVFPTPGSALGPPWWVPSFGLGLTEARSNRSFFPVRGVAMTAKKWLYCYVLM